jgi:hypothetical protein
MIKPPKTFKFILDFVKSPKPPTHQAMLFKETQLGKNLRHLNAEATTCLANCSSSTGQLQFKQPTIKL